MNETKNYIQEDEIDLKEIFKTIWAKRVFVVSFTLLVTICTFVFVSLQTKEPIYKGSVLIEVGELQLENSGLNILDNPNNLATIIVNMFEHTVASAPKGTNKLIEITNTNTDKAKIKDNLQEVVEFILKRHHEKASFYDKYIMTKQIGKIKIDERAINEPKKSLMVAISFVTGFILSIFLVFFMQFIQSFKEEK
jgi:capsular polysaccharide biosynthesis protein